MIDHSVYAVERLTNPILDRRLNAIAERKPLVWAALSEIAPRTVRQLCVAIHGTMYTEDRRVMEMILYDLHDEGMVERAGPLTVPGWEDRWGRAAAIGATDALGTNAVS